MGFLGAAVVSLAALASAATVPHSNVKRQVSQLRNKYDFVIVGGGTSGLTIADRVSAALPSSRSNRGTQPSDGRQLTSFTENVLVIEYGDVPFAPGVFDPPTDWITAAPDSPPSWTFFSLPNPDMGGAQAVVVAGQAVGGSSTVNGMFFDRGSRFDYDSWAEVGGPEFAQSSNIEWNWRGLFPYFKKVSAANRLKVNVWLPGNC